MDGRRARHRVVVTGVGPITSIGTGKASFWSGLVEGRRGARPIDLPWMTSRFRCRVGAPVEVPDLSPWGIGEQDARLLDPATRLALGATWVALEDAGLRPHLRNDEAGRVAVDGVDPERAGVILGSGIGGISRSSGPTAVGPWASR